MYSIEDLKIIYEGLTLYLRSLHHDLIEAEQHLDSDFFSSIAVDINKVIKLREQVYNQITELDPTSDVDLLV